MITDMARPESQKRSRPWRWAKVAGNLAGLLAGLLFLAVLGLILAAAALPLFGYRTTVINGGSMAPAIGRGSLVISGPVEPETLAVDDIITFRRPEAKVSVTHRITAIREEDGQRFFTVKGDANSSADPGEMSFDGQVEKMTLTLPHIGYIISFARTTQGMLLLLLLPATGLAMLQVLSMGRGRQGKEEARV